MRCSRPLAFVALALFSGCTCGSKHPPAPGVTAGAVAAPVASASDGAAAAGARLDLAVFSAPIAAARVAHQDIVAGLVAADGVIRVMGLADGKAAWATDVLSGVAWAP